MTAKPKLSAKLGVMAALLIVALSIAGCGAGAGSQKPAKTRRPAAQAHVIPKKDYNDALRDVALNIKLLNKVRDDTQTLERFLTEAALKGMIEQINADLAAGKVKVRRLLKVKLKFANYTKGVAGINMSYVDGSYYVDKSTGKKLSQPTNKKEKRVLALKKTGGRWKIFGIFGDLKPNVPRR